MSLNKEVLYSLINEVIDNEYNSIYKSPAHEENSITPSTPKEDTISETITPKEFESMKKNIISILRNMEPDMKRQHVADIARPFGFMSFQQFLKVQNTMVDSADGKLDDPKK